MLPKRLKPREVAGERGLTRPVTAALGALALSGCTAASALSVSDTNAYSPGAKALKSRTTVSMLRAGAAAERAGNMAVATKAYANASRGTGGAKARVALGRVLLKDNKPRKAQEAFETVLKSAPGTTGARIGLGQSQLALGSYDAALASFDAALGQKLSAADRRRALLGGGISLDGLGRHDEAQARYRSVLETRPNDAAALNNLGLSLAVSGERKEAITVLRRVAGGSDASPRARQNLALAYALAGEEDSARRVSMVDLSKDDTNANLRTIRSARR